ncbi:MAG: hypothetical protein ACLFN5_06235 [bacterium]
MKIFKLAVSFWQRGDLLPAASRLKKQLSIPIVIVTVVFALTVCLLNPARAGCENIRLTAPPQYYLAARDSIQINEIAEAANYLDRLFVEHPAHPGGIKLKLKLILKQDSVDSALEVGRSILKVTPDPCLVESILKVFDGQDEAQLQLLEFAFDSRIINKDSAAKHLRLLANKGYFTRALLKGKLYLSEFRGVPELLLQTGRAAFKLGEHDQAQFYLENAYRQRQGNPEYTKWLLRFYRSCNYQVRENLLAGRWRALTGKPHRWDEE